MMTDKTWQLGLAGMGMIAVAFGFARYGYGLFVPVFRDEFGLSTGSLGLISGGSYASYLIALLLAGFLSSRLNPRFPIVLAGLFATTGMILIAAAPNSVVLAAGVLIASTSPGWAWAPFSDAVAQLIKPGARNRTLSIVSTGTAFGLLVSGPITLFAGSTWRVAWLLFALVALACTIWNARILPNKPFKPSSGAESQRGARGANVALDRSRPTWRWYVNTRSLPLFLVALIFGFTGAFYWTYAADIVLDNGLPPATRSILWTLVGITGVAGLATGDLVGRFGLRRVLVAALLLLTVAIALLGLSPGSWLAIGISASLYGPSFMMMSALLALWSSDVFPDRPSAGFSATLLLLAVGSIGGPTTLGLIADLAGLRSLFLVAAGLTLIGLIGAIPRRWSAAAMSASGDEKTLTRLNARQG
ncbi:MFS transporter [Hoyosella altamirensis]|nr:MFS transporter [Hoyosella altamirensis]